MISFPPVKIWCAAIGRLPYIEKKGVNLRIRYSLVSHSSHGRGRLLNVGSANGVENLAGSSEH